MKKINVILFCGLLSVISCKNNKNEKNENINVDKSRLISKHFLNKIIIQQYDSLGALIVKKTFNKDSIADGAEIHYYPNGKIKKWVWYRADKDIPYTGVYYDTNGVYSHYKGALIIDVFSLHEGKDIYIEMANPPNVNFLLKFTDSLNGKLVKKDFYDPGLTDSIAFVKLDRFDFNKLHKYSLIYYFFEKKNGKLKKLDSAYTTYKGI
jgi:hypothetical protein